MTWLNVYKETAKSYNNLEYNGESLHETLGEVEKFLIVDLTIANTPFNSTFMEAEGNYWMDMEENLGSSLREILKLDFGTLTQIKLLGKFNISGNYPYKSNSS